MKLMPRSVRKTFEHSWGLFSNPYAVGILVALIIGTILLLMPLPA
jgi:hypothetical protein